MVCFHKMGYEDWRPQVVKLLEDNGFDVGYAFDIYSFLIAWDEWDMTPEEAVEDYLKSQPVELYVLGDYR